MAWLVTYKTFQKPRRSVRRWFTREASARAFYRKLWRRREPPLSQKIEEAEKA